MFRKAYTAALVGLVGALGVAFSDGDITLAEAFIALGAGLTAGAGTYQVRNKRG